MRIFRITLISASVILFVVFILLVMRGELYIPPRIVLGPFSVHMYSLTAISAFAVGAYLFQYFGRQDKRLAKVDVVVGLLYVLIPALIGARIYHVLTDWQLYQSNLTSILYVWNGGMGFIGGVVGGLLGALFYIRWHKLPALAALSILALILPLCQAVGRLGNLFNRELFGFPTNLPWGQYVESEFRPYTFKTAEYFHPLFLYEALGNVLLFCLLYYFWKRWNLAHSPAPRRQQQLIMIYLAGYGIIRYLLDFLRIDGNSGFSGLTYAQWLILGGFLSVLVLGVVYQLGYYRRYQKWFRG